MGPIWDRQDPDGPQVGPMNLVIWNLLRRPWYQLLFLLKLFICANEAAIILDFGLTNERRRYNTTSCPIGWAATLNDPCQDKQITPYEWKR